MIKSAGDFIAEAQAQINCVDIPAAKKIFDESQDAVILDVREEHSAAESKLKDSVNISRGLIEMKVPGVCPDVDTVILTHCGGGGRASLAALRLQEMGYKRVYAITAKYDDIKQVFG